MSQTAEYEANMKSETVKRLTPVGMTTLVFRLPHVVESKSGIAIPDNYKEKNYYALLLKKGKGESFPNGNKRPSTNAQPGDIVIIRAFEGKPAVVYDKNLLLVDGDRIEAAASKKPWSISPNESKPVATETQGA